MASLKEEIKSVAKEMGVDKIGFTIKERLKGGPPSADLTTALPSAKSAISICVALDKGVIRPFLSKQDQWGHDSNHKAAYFKVNLVGQTIQRLLEDNGYEAAVPIANLEYKEGPPLRECYPLTVSHKYVAVASGIGWYGWNHLVVTPEYGAPVVLGSVITSAELEPDEPLEQGDWCQGCRLCAASCPTHFMFKDDEETLTLAGRTYTHSKIRTKSRCWLCCGGITGVNDDTAKFSSWQADVLGLPGPDADDEAFEQRILEYAEDPKYIRLKFMIDFFGPRLGITNFEEFNWMMLNNMAFVCGHCMLICWPEMKDRQENYRLLTESGRATDSEFCKKLMNRPYR